MAEIKKEDIFEPGVIEAPLEMAKNMDKLLASIQGIIKAGKQSEAVLETATSTKKLTDETKNLSTAQTELEKVQKQFATSTQKLSDEYLANKRAITAVNDEVKKKLELGDREAKDINEKNSSLKQLEVALNANRKAYADLGGEQARSTKSGQELLNIIKSQSDSAKALRESLGQVTDHTKEHREATEKTNESLEILNEKIGGAITMFQGLGKQLWALVANPVIAFLAALAVGFEVLKTAAELYYEETLKGEEALKREMVQDDAFFRVYKGFWAELGEVVAFAWWRAKEEYKNYAFAISSDEIKEKLKAAGDAANKAADADKANFREKTRNIIEYAKLEEDIAKELEITRDKENYTAVERENAIIKVRGLIESQLERKKEQAKNELAAEELLLTSQSKKVLKYEEYDAVLGRVVTKTKLVSELSDEEIAQTEMNAEQLESLAKAQANVINVETEASERRRSLFKQENKIIAELRAEDLADKKKIDDAIKKELEKQQADAEAALADFEEAEKRAVKNFQDNEKVKASNRKAGFDKWVQDAKDANAEVDEDAQAEFNATKKRNAEELKEEEKKSKAKEKLYAATANFIRAVYVGAATERINQLETESVALQEQKNKELAAAGNNADGRAKIEARFALKQIEIQKQISEEKRKQAVFEKDLRIANTIINTAKAIAEALPDIPLSIIVAAIGALELGAIIATPIPKFELGTKHSPEGVAIVGEKGAELIKQPGKDWTISPNSATMINLAAGSEVVPHEETMRRLALGSLRNESFVDGANFALHGKIIALQETIKEIGAQTVKAIESSKVDFEQHGSILYKVIKKADGSKQLIRAKSISQ